MKKHAKQAFCPFKAVCIAFNILLVIIFLVLYFSDLNDDGKQLDYTAIFITLLAAATLVNIALVVVWGVSLRGEQKALVMEREIESKQQIREWEISLSAYQTHRSFKLRERELEKANDKKDTPPKKDPLSEQIGKFYEKVLKTTTEQLNKHYKDNLPGGNSEEGNNPKKD